FCNDAELSRQLFAHSPRHGWRCIPSTFSLGSLRPCNTKKTTGEELSMDLHTLKASALSAAIAAACASPSVASAQDNAPALSPGLEEIVVTARRREESLQDVPVAVSAF